MRGFIQIKSKEGKWRCINIKYIEEVIETEKGCTIYLAFNCPSATEQDYIETDKSYDEVVTMLWKGSAE